LWSALKRLVGGRAGPPVLFTGLFCCLTAVAVQSSERPLPSLSWDDVKHWLSQEGGLGVTVNAVFAVIGLVISIKQAFDPKPVSEAEFRETAGRIETGLDGVHKGVDETRAAVDVESEKADSRHRDMMEALTAIRGGASVEGFQKIVSYIAEQPLSDAEVKTLIEAIEVRQAAAGEPVSMLGTSALSTLAGLAQSADRSIREAAAAGLLGETEAVSTQLAASAESVLGDARIRIRLAAKRLADAAVLAAERDPAAAIRLYNRSAELHDGDASVWRALALLHSGFGQNEEAARAIAEAERVERGDEVDPVERSLHDRIRPAGRETAAGRLHAGLSTMLGGRRVKLRLPPRVSASVRERIVETFAAGREEDWPGRPLVAGHWAPIDEPLASAIADQLRLGETDDAYFFSFALYHQIDGLRVLPLGCFQEPVFLIEGAGVADEGRRGLFNAVLWQSGLELLMADSQLIHRLNAAQGLLLHRPEHRIEYVEFFMNAIAGTEGRFRTGRVAEDLLLPPPGETYLDGDGIFTALHERDGGPEEDGRWRYEGSVVYADMLFSRELTLAPDGLVEMASDTGVDPEKLDGAARVREEILLPPFRIANEDD